VIARRIRRISDNFVAGRNPGSLSLKRGDSLLETQQNHHADPIPVIAFDDKRPRFVALRPPLQSLGFRASCFMFRDSGSGFRVSCFEFRIPGFVFRVPSSGFCVSGFGFRVPGFVFHVSCFVFRVPGFGSQVPGSGFRVLGVGFRVSVSEFRVPSSGVRVSCFVFRVPGSRFRAPGVDESATCDEAASLGSLHFKRKVSSEMVPIPWQIGDTIDGGLRRNERADQRIDPLFLSWHDG
jgi:hypothetical protein